MSIIKKLFIQDIIEFSEYKKTSVNQQINNYALIKVKSWQYRDYDTNKVSYHKVRWILYNTDTSLVEYETKGRLDNSVMFNLKRITGLNFRCN